MRDEFVMLYAHITCTYKRDYLFPICSKCSMVMGACWLVSWPEAGHETTCLHDGGMAAHSKHVFFFGFFLLQ